MKGKTKQGFTLMELLLVIFIIGILATASISTFGPQVRQAGWLGESRSNISRIKSAIISYRDQKGEYPRDLPTLAASGLFDMPIVKSSTYTLTGSKDTYKIEVKRTITPNAGSSISVDDKGQETISWVE